MKNELKIIPIKELEIIVQKVESFGDRYDIPLEVYECMLGDHEAYWELLQENPSCYENKEELDRAMTLNRYICLLINLKITECLEIRYKAG
jgi:hypothetical protein